MVSKASSNCQLLLDDSPAVNVDNVTRREVPVKFWKEADASLLSFTIEPDGKQTLDTSKGLRTRWTPSSSAESLTGLRYAVPVRRIGSLLQTHLYAG